MSGDQLIVFAVTSKSEELSLVSNLFWRTEEEERKPCSPSPSEECHLQKQQRTTLLLDTHELCCEVQPKKTTAVYFIYLFITYNDLKKKKLVILPF